MYAKIILPGIFTSFALLAQSQNLVGNGNFEVYSACPTGTSSQSNMQINLATGWTQSTLTPDYFNACNANSVNVPSSYHGHQIDCCGGHAYAGAYFLDAAATNNDDREYIETTLLDTLLAGHKYLASMYVSRADFNYSIATAGMYFTQNSTYLPWPQGYIPASPQVKYNYLLSDTINWILVQDTFVAVGNERILTIGNFNSNATSDSVRSPGGFGTWGYFGAAYYYMDGVSVYDIAGGACNSYWDAGPDKFIFKGDSIRLGAINTDNSTYAWINSIGGNTFLTSNGDARPWSSPSVTTTYYVTKTCPDNTVFNDTIIVYVTDTSSAGVNQINLTDRGITIYPNPSNGTFSVKYALASDSKIEITDVTGKLVGKSDLGSSENVKEIINGHLQNGLYLYRITTLSGDVVKAGKLAILN